ncbi:MAG: hypothetical protein AAF127_04715 [Pseudomonadota bacterium]
MHERNATMKVVDNSANLVIAVPVSAYEGVDTDADGLLSPREIELGQSAMATQFTDNFQVSDGTVIGREALTYVLSPETHRPQEPVDYVVVMQRVFFDEVPRSPTVAFTLFGEEQPDAKLTLRATYGNYSETAVLSPSNTQHTFFHEPAASPFPGAINPTSVTPSLPFATMLLLAAMVIAALSGAFVFIARFASA